MAIIDGTFEQDTLVGTAGNDIINGFGSDDVLDGGGGRDVINGGDGDDLLDIYAASDIVAGEQYDGGSGRDDITLRFRGNSDFSKIDIRGFERLLQTAREYDVGLTAAQLDGLSDISVKSVTLKTAGSVVLTGNIDVDTFNLSAGGNSLDLSGTKWGGTANGGSGDDVVIVGSFPNQLYGNGGNDRLTGASFDDKLYGGAGDDILAGAAGSDQLFGGDGNDDLSGGLDDDLLDGGAGNDRIDGGAGPDILSYASAAGGVTVNLAVTTAQDTGGSGIDTILNIEHLIGTRFADVLIGNASENAITGGDGNDLVGGGLGTAADYLDGGAGTDTVSYAEARAGVVVSLSLTDAQNTVGGGIDTLSGFENVAGSAFNDVLTGTAGNNLLSGGGGNDVLVGGLGYDVLDGGAGIDTASYATAAAAVSGNLATGKVGGDGTDILIGIENLTGSRFDDTLTGDAGANSLAGGVGNDVLTGGAGNDLLDGGAGIDVASYADAVSAVTVSLRLETRQNTLGAGVDTLIGIEDLRGSAFDDSLSGNGGANVLNGGAGIDTADYAGAVAGVHVSLAITGRQNTVGDGVDTLTGIENLNGTGFDDQLTGDVRNNRLNGGGGNDLLVGGLGDDFLSGGAGIDTASYAGLGVRVTVNLGITAAQNTVGGGTDTLVGIENLVGTNYGDTLTGNAFANIISGGNGDDMIDAGGGGAGYGDLLDGGLGNDRIKGGGGGDTLVGGAGTDVMTGGVGDDEFIFNAATDSRPGQIADRITDFAAGDILDLSAIDANANTIGANENFAHVANFTGAARQLTLAFDAVSNMTTLLADTTGDGVADFSILFAGDVAPAITANWVL